MIRRRNFGTQRLARPVPRLATASMPTRTERVVGFLLFNPGASSLEIATACRTLNVRGRISDARKAGYRIEAARNRWGVSRYWLHDPLRSAEPRDLELTA